MSWVGFENVLSARDPGWDEQVRPTLRAGLELLGPYQEVSKFHFSSDLSL